LARLTAALLASATFVSTLVAGPSAAEAKPNMDVAHVLGRDATWIVGWNEAVVTLENKDQPAWRGEVVVDPTYDHRSLDRPTVRVPVTLAAGESARLVLPFYLPAGSWPTVIMVEGGKDAFNQPLGLTHPIGLGGLEGARPDHRAAPAGDCGGGHALYSRGERICGQAVVLSAGAAKHAGPGGSLARAG